MRVYVCEQVAAGTKQQQTKQRSDRAASAAEKGSTHNTTFERLLFFDQLLHLTRTRTHLSIHLSGFDTYAELIRRRLDRTQSSHSQVLAIPTAYLRTVALVYVVCVYACPCSGGVGDGGGGATKRRRLLLFSPMLEIDLKSSNSRALGLFFLSPQ